MADRGETFFFLEYSGRNVGSLAVHVECSRVAVEER